MAELEKPNVELCVDIVSNKVRKDGLKIPKDVFVISDSVLAFVYFTPVKRKNPLVTIELATYYTGQILMAATVYLIK